MMKKMLSLAVVGLCFALPVQAATLEIGKPAPEIMATDINGDAFKLSDHKGKTIVLEWTNAQCPFVVKHYDTNNMQDTQKKARAMENVEWVSINSSALGKQGQVDAAGAKAVLAEQGAEPTTMLLDPEGTIGKAYGAQTTPHMFIIDANGDMAYMGAIDSNPSPRASSVEGATNYVLAALEDLSAGNGVSMPITQPYGCSVKY